MVFGNENNALPGLVSCLSFHSCCRKMPKHAAMPTNWARTIINNPMPVKLGSIFGPRDMPPLLIGTREMGKNLETSNTWLALLGCSSSMLNFSFRFITFERLKQPIWISLAEQKHKNAFLKETNCKFLLPLFAISIFIGSMLINSRTQNQESKFPKVYALLL